jgi:hypothetical protein
MGDAEDEKEEKGRKKCHTKEIERKMEIMQTGKRKIRCWETEDGIEDRDKKEDRTKKKEEKKLT